MFCPTCHSTFGAPSRPTKRGNARDTCLARVMPRCTRANPGPLDTRRGVRSLATSARRASPERALRERAAAAAAEGRGASGAGAGAAAAAAQGHARTGVGQVAGAGTQGRAAQWSTGPIRRRAPCRGTRERHELGATVSACSISASKSSRCASRTSRYWLTPPRSGSRRGRAPSAGPEPAS